MNIFKRMTFFGMPAIYVASFLLLAGNGLQGVLVLSRARIEEFGLFLTGALTTSYFIGFLCGCFLTPQILNRVGHIRAFTALAAFAACIAGAYSLIIAPAPWILLRFFNGLALAGLYVVLESWLNEMSPAGKNGQVLAAYRLAELSAIIIGQLLLLSAPITSPSLFTMVSVFICLSLIPISLTSGKSPLMPEQHRIRLKKVYQTSPQSLVGCLLTGSALASFWGFAPHFMTEIGGTLRDGPLYLSCYLIGGFIAQWPVGKLSDRFDRRVVLNRMTLLGLVASALILVVLPQAPDWKYWLAGLFGMAATPLYSLCVAHANDRSERRNFVEISSGLLIAYGLGAAIGPIIASGASAYLGKYGLFGFITMTFLIQVAFNLKRSLTSAPVPIEAQKDFVPISDITVKLDLDPRAR